jgi:pyridoxamine 5'-phosphate oxidase-like protein
MPAQHTAFRLTDEVWRDLAKGSFAVVSHVTDAGEPRSSGVVYALVGRHMYIAVAPDSWKARHVQTGDRLSVTVPVRRGGLLSLLFPIPPATISFHATVTVHPADSITRSSLPKPLQRLLPPAGDSPICMLELAPEGQFLTYGIGVSLMEMRNPTIARSHAPTA